MHRRLIIHPDLRCAAVTAIEADVARSGAGNLMLEYVVTGRIGDLRMPPAAAGAAAARTDELWRHTCFEAFIRTAAAAYCEFNFAPSTQWAAYRFDGYRNGMRAAAGIGAPRIVVQSSPRSYRLQVALDLAQMTDLPRGTVWQIGIAAVIEDRNGDTSYWALAHPPGKADFHHADGFVLDVS